MSGKMCIEKGYEGIYAATEDGEIINTVKGFTLSQSEFIRSGYMRVNLYNHGNSRTQTVHRLVYEAFNGPVPKGMEIDHIDGNKHNNSITNLRVVTHSENMKGVRRNKRYHKHPIVCRETGTIFESIKEALLWCGGRNNGRICESINKPFSTYGYHWRDINAEEQEILREKTAKK